MADQTETKPAESTTAPGPVAPPPAVPKPPATTKKVTESPAPSGPDKTRRTIIWSLVWGYFGVNFLMFLRSFFPRTLFEPKTIFSIGYPQDFGLGVETKFQREFRIWVDKVPGRIFVIYARCTHLGCTPDWKPAENKFKCPCHGSGYDSEAINFEGPAPRPMDRAHIELAPDGQVLVDTSKLYSWPKGQPSKFNDPGAFLTGV